MSILEKINKMALEEEASKQPEVIKRLLLDCSEHYTRLVEGATDMELKCAVKIGRKYLTDNEVRLLAMEEELEKRQKKIQKHGQDRRKSKINQCPACKGQAALKEVWVSYQKTNGGMKTEKQFYVQCSSCGTSTGEYINKSLAIKEWNNRVK